MTKAVKEEFRLSENTTPEFLVDELGKWREKKSEAERMEGFFKEALKARLDGQTEVAGEEFSATITSQERTGLDTGKIEAEIGIEECRNRGWYKTTSFDVIRTKRTA